MWNKTSRILILLTKLLHQTQNMHYLHTCGCPAQCTKSPRSLPIPALEIKNFVFLHTTCWTP